jgi:ATP-dependent Clp protease protease subunit
MGQRLNELMAKYTGQTLKKIHADTDRDFFMDPDTARKYGIIDEVLEKRK